MYWQKTEKNLNDLLQKAKKKQRSQKNKILTVSTKKYLTNDVRQNYYNYLVENQNTNENIIENINISKGRAFSRMSAQSIAHLLMVIFIVLGKIWIRNILLVF